MNRVQQIKEACAVIRTAFILGKTQAAKELGVGIENVMSINEIAQVDLAFIDEVRDDNEGNNQEPY